jgi:DNA-binding YbaB/EbfC family protein
MTMPAPRAPLATVIAAVPASAPETTPLGDRWALRVQPLGEQGRIGALVRELAWQAGVTDCVEGPDACTWTLVVERESLRTDSLRDKLAAALSAEEGKPHQLVLEAGVPGDSVARREAWERLRRQAEAEQLIPMMKNQLAGLMKQAQAMQDNLKKAQDELATIEVEGQSGAGLVKVTMTCKHDVKRVAIDPSLLAEDKDMLEDLVAAAFNDAGAPRRDHQRREDGQADRRHAAAAGHEVPVLMAVAAERPRRA